MEEFDDYMDWQDSEDQFSGEILSIGAVSPTFTRRFA